VAIVNQCGKLLTEAMQRAFGTAKELAYAGGFSVATAERYRRGDSFPDGLTLTLLMSKSRVITDAVLRMAGLDDLSLDQEQARLCRSLAEIEQRRAARNEDLAAAYAVAGVGPPATSGARAASRRTAIPAADGPVEGTRAPTRPGR
jgi:hypothetical protein